MKYTENHFYHIYNQGNNRDPIFFTSKNYYHFLHKMEKHLIPNCDILAYCLMPNHFHWLIKVKKEGTKPGKAFIPRYAGQYSINERDTTHSQQQLSMGIGTLLSSYTKAINLQNNTTGSLFRCKTKSKCIDELDNHRDYLATCFHYILDNPVKAKISVLREEYPYSSAYESMHKSKKGLVNLRLLDECRLLDSA